MPQEFQHTHDLLSRRPRRRRDIDSDASATTDDPMAPTAHKSESPVAAGTSGERDLAQFSLLADPSTISGRPTTRRAGEDANAEEVARLRSALHAQSREMAQLHRNTATSPAPPTRDRSDVPASIPTPRTDGNLLNSDEARRLAEDARAREKAIRAELSSAQDEMRSDAERIAIESPPNNSVEKSRRWKTHSLVRGQASEAVESTGEGAMRSGRASHNELEPPSSEHKLLLAANAEMRELRATLSIARKTTLGQKREIASLREQLHHQASLRKPATQEDEMLPAENDARSGSLDDQELSRRLEKSRTESSGLQERLRLNDQEFSARNAERTLLRCTLDQRENEISTRRREQDELQDRFDVQDRALNDARNQLAQERSRNTESQELFSQLRRTLDGDAISATPSLPVEVMPTPRSMSERELTDVPSSILLDDYEIPASRAHQDLADPEALSSDAAHTNPVQLSFTRPAVFDAWQDDQIRRQFGPMGIDTIIDLLRAPLARRNQSNLQPEQSLVLIGRGAWQWAPTLAEGLIQNGTPPFTIHVCDPSTASVIAAEGLTDDHPIHGFLQPLPYPRSPPSLGDSLDELRPTALISRDFLSTEIAIEPWLNVLSTAAGKGVCLLFSERTGIAQHAPPAEIAEMGDRIWKRMPERYKHEERSGTIPSGSSTWRRVFMESEAQSTRERPPNHLLARLRDRFQLEMLAKFGFLAEPFVATPIGENFDKDATRDRKFLHQVAELDDQKIEAGIVPGLHLVAVVDQESQN